MDWAFLLQDNKSQKIILRLPRPRSTRNPARRGEYLTRPLGSRPFVLRNSLKSCEGVAQAPPERFLRTSGLLPGDALGIRHACAGFRVGPWSRATLELFFGFIVLQ